MLAVQKKLKAGLAHRLCLPPTRRQHRKLGRIVGRSVATPNDVQVGSQQEHRRTVHVAHALLIELHYLERRTEPSERLLQGGGVAIATQVEQRVVSAQPVLQGAAVT